MLIFVVETNKGSMKGFKDLIENVEPFEYKKFDISMMQEAIKQLTVNQMPVRQGPYPIIGSNFSIRAFNATVKGDREQLSKLKKEAYSNKIKRIRSISKRFNLDYDIAFLLYNKYSYYDNRFTLLIEDDEEYDGSYTATYLVGKESGKFHVITLHYSGYNTEKLDSFIIDKEDIFNLLIVNDFTA
jgi:hypothetical protein